MNLIERAKNIILKPKDEWFTIDQETTSVQQLVTGYLIPMALIPATVAFIHYGLFGLGPFVPTSVSGGIKQALVSFVATIGGAYLSAFIIDALATNFGSVKDFRKAMQLVVYSYTATFIASVFQIIPGLGFLGILALYGLYLLYLGLAPLMKTPQDKVTGYFVVSLLVIIIVYILIGAILSAIIIGGSYFNSFKM